MKEIILNGSAMTTRATAHDEIARALELPETYGRNLDALWDVLNECEWTITLENTASMLNSLEVYGCKLMQTFFEAKRVRFTAR